MDILAKIASIPANPVLGILYIVSFIVAMIYFARVERRGRAAKAWGDEATATSILTKSASDVVVLKDAYIKEQDARYAELKGELCKTQLDLEEAKAAIRRLEQQLVASGRENHRLHAGAELLANQVISLEKEPVWKP